MALQVAKVTPVSGALAGAIGAGASLAAGELVSGILSGVPSPVTAVGQWVINSAPQPAVQTGIKTFGTSDKPALVVGTIVIAVVLGALLGVAGTRRSWVVPAGFSVFGVLGIAASTRLVGTSVAGTVVTAILAVAVGALVYHLLLRAPAPAAPPPPVRARAAASGSARARQTAPHRGGPQSPGPNKKAPGGGSSRRSFLILSGAAIAATAGAAELGRMLHKRMASSAAREAVVLPAPITPAPVTPAGSSFADVPGLSPLFTPNASFYRIDTALVVPDVDVTSWKLQLTGMVDHPFTLNFDDLLAMPMEAVDLTISCVSNEVGGDLVGNATWLGVPLKTLLDRAGVQPGATQLVGRSVDDFTVGFPTAVLADGRHALVAVGMNGEPLPSEHGFPARLIVAGLYGYVSATKWLTQIELTTLEAYDAYWIERGWDKDGPIKTQSRIDVPRSPGTNLHPGTVNVAGVAWAPTRGIGKVELQVDQGPWMNAELSTPLTNDTWRQWRVAWNATPGVHSLRVRATDGTGQLQDATVAPPEPNGATGYHTIEVRIPSS